MTQQPTPLPDEVEQALINLWITSDGVNKNEHEETIRAHIAALEAENKRLREAAEIGAAYVAAAQAGLSFTQLRMKSDMAVFEAAIAENPATGSSGIAEGDEK